MLEKSVGLYEVITTAEISRMRLSNARLAGDPLKRPAEVVSWLGAVQAQDYAGAKWALAQRCAEGVTNAEIDALFNAGEILRTHVMRPTWHFVAPGDLRWLLKLTAPRLHQANACMYRRLEIDARVCRRSDAVIAQALAGGRQLTREEIGGVLKKNRVVASGQRLAYIVMHAELEGLICSGPLRGKQFTYALLEERVPRAKPLDREGALAELARRFFTSHGPAQLDDFAWWSGLTKADVREGLERASEHLVSDVMRERTFWFAPALAKPVVKSEGSHVHLLPNYDELFIAYRDNRESLPPEVLNKLKSDPDALSLHVIACNGRVAGGWRRTVGKREIVLTRDVFVKLSKREHRALERATEAYGRFMELPVKVLVR